MPYALAALAATTIVQVLPSDQLTALIDLITTDPLTIADMLYYTQEVIA